MDALFIITSIVTLALGAGLVMAPSYLLSYFGVVDVTVSGVMLARLFGSALIAFPVLLFYVRKSLSRDFRRAMSYGMFAYYLLSSAILGYARLAGQMNDSAWSLVVLHGALALWYGYFVVQFK